MLQMYMFFHQILHYLVKLKLHVLRKCQWYVANMCSFKFEMDCRAKLNFIKKNTLRQRQMRSVIKKAAFQLKISLLTYENNAYKLCRLLQS